MLEIEVGEMENRSLALKLISEAVHLDSSGFYQAAFGKYLQSLQVLALYMNDLFTLLGFQKVLEKVREIKHVTCMIHDCSDRINAIMDKAAHSVLPQKSETVTQKKPDLTSNEVISAFRHPELEKIQNENRALLKNYKWRFERTSDNLTRSNLKLELKRRLAENDILAKRKFESVVKELQKERALLMEKEMKKLLESQIVLDEKEREKRDLYTSVLEYAKTETWPCTWKLHSWEDSDIDTVKKVFQKTIRCYDHPLSQWLRMVQTNIKREVDITVKKYRDCHKLLPLNTPDSEKIPCHVEESSNEYIFHIDSEQKAVSKQTIANLQKELDPISSEIIYIINNVVHIFYLTYKSLLPPDCEEICLSLIESYILKPIWPNLIVLYRILNIISEYKILEAMHLYKDLSPSEFGYPNQNSFDPVVREQTIVLLKSVPNTESLIEKAKILVEVLQFLCKGPSPGNKNLDILGADELMPLLCFVIVRTKLSQLSSECFAIEQLFDMKFMFGEEGYALSSFLTALKYIEMKKLIDGENQDEAIPQTNLK